MDGSKDFASGIERLLAQLQRFEATQRDFDLFTRIESKFFELVKQWNNFMAAQGIDGYQIIPDDAELRVNFEKPQKMETQDEKEARVIRLKNEGILPKKRAIMDILDIPEEEALRIMQELDKETFGELLDTGESNSTGHIHELPDGSFSGPSIPTTPGNHRHEGLSEEKDGEGHTHTTEAGEETGPPVDGEDND